MAAALRLEVRSVRTMVAHQYYFVITLHDAALDPARVSVKRASESRWSGASDLSALTSDPEFKHKTFYFRLGAGADAGSGGDGGAAASSVEQFLRDSSITCQLFASDASTEVKRAKDPTGKDVGVPAFVDELVGASTERLTNDQVAKLLGSGGKAAAGDDAGAADAGAPLDLAFKCADVAVVHARVTCVSNAAVLSGGESAATCKVLLNDVISQQRALSVIQEEARTLGEDSDRYKTQCSGLTYQNRLLQDEVGEMRKILDEERRAAKAAPQLQDWEDMSKSDVVKRAEQALNLHRKEQTRNAELMHQMKRMHAKAIELEDHMRSFRELQDAHAAQSKQLGQMEEENTRVGQLKATVATQEKIISKLERVLVSPYPSQITSTSFYTIPTRAHGMLPAMATLLASSDGRPDHPSTLARIHSRPLSSPLLSFPFLSFPLLFFRSLLFSFFISSPPPPPHTAIEPCSQGARGEGGEGGGGGPGDERARQGVGQAQRTGGRTGGAHDLA